MPCGVCVTSIFESNKANKIRVHILTNGFTDDTVRRFEETAKKYGQIIDIHTIDDSLIAGLQTGNHFTIMAYARLLFPRVLDESVSKLLYLDCDIIAVSDLLKLWSTEFGDCACMAVADAWIHTNKWIQDKTESNGHLYVNSGVLLMNLPKWREFNLGERCIEYVMQYPDKCPYVDQDAINDIICKNIGFLHLKYNFQTRFQYRHQSTLFSDEYALSTFDEARRAPVIIHYSSNIKPWHKEYFLCYSATFVKLLRGSEWSDYKMSYKKYRGAKLMMYYIRESLRWVRSTAYRLSYRG